MISDRRGNVWHISISQSYHTVRTVSIINKSGWCHIQKWGNSDLFIKCFCFSLFLHTSWPYNWVINKKVTILTIVPLLVDHKVHKGVLVVSLTDLQDLFFNSYDSFINIPLG